MSDSPEKRHRKLAERLLGELEPESLPVRERAPSHIGRYRVRGQLGRGGMGVVFEGEDESGVRVAIKLLTEGEGTQAEQRERFEREARAVNNVRHPSVIRLVDEGTYEGAPFFAFELHPGGSLRELLKREGPLPPLRVAELGAQIADGLAAAHELGILHRDVKPANVLLNAEGRAVLCDFGLVKDTQLRVDNESLTQTGTFLGTPGYLAPEQIDSRLPKGPGADLYGLGATLYDLLTGRPPIVGEGLAEVIAATYGRTPPSPISFRPEIPPALAAIVMRCLRKDPAQRWRSATELAAALRGVATPSTRWRSWGIAGAAAVSVIALAALTSGDAPAPAPVPNGGGEQTQPEDDAADDSARVAWEAYRGARSDLARYVAGRRLLGAHPDHPEASAVRPRLTRLRARSTPLATLQMAQARVAVSFVGDVLLGFDGTAQLVTWDSVSGEQLESYTVGRQAHGCVVLSEPLELLLCCGGRTESGVLRWSPNAAPSWVVRGSVETDAVAVHARWVVAGRDNGDFDPRVFARPGLELVGTLEGLEHPAVMVAISPDGSLVAGAGRPRRNLPGEPRFDTGELVIWELPSGPQLTKHALRYHPRCLLFSDDSQTLFVGSNVGTLEARDPRTGELRYAFEGENQDAMLTSRAHESTVRDMAQLSPDHLLSVGRDSTGESPQANQLRVWRLSDRELVYSLDELPGAPASVAVHRELGLVAIGTYEGQVLLYPIPELR